METEERMRLLEHWMERAEFRLASMEADVKMAKLALTAVRWAVGVAIATAIIVAVQRILGQ